MKKIIVATLVTIAITGSVTSVLPNKANTVYASSKKDNNVSNKIFKQAKKDTEEFLKQDDFVDDIYIERKGTKITIAIVVNASANKKYAEDIADTALRQLNTNAKKHGAKISASKKDSWGGIYDKNTATIGVGTDSDNFIFKKYIQKGNNDGEF